MKKIIFLFLFGLLSLPIFAQPKLSEETEVSLMTSAPYDEEVFTVYGHAAIRVHDPKQKIDYIFNYGIFDFSKPNFIYRFAKGETDYKLGVANFQDYVINYQMSGSEITEQVLNLTQQEKDAIWDALLINYKPENRVYRYNFFFDNCATRPAAILEKVILGKIDYHYPYEAKSFRDIINYCTRNHPWLTFGCDLALGSPTDREATQHEMLFIPGYLKDAFSKGTITNEDQEVRPLVKETRTIAAAPNELERNMWDIFTPMVCASLFFILIASLTFMEWKQKKYFLTIDCIVFGVAGTAGIVLFYLSFISTHPCIWPNWSLLWLHPLHWLGVILFCVKKLKIAANYFHFINFAALTMMLLGWYFIPQHLNTAFFPLVASVWLRSGSGFCRNIWKTK